jgi:hypothetical protein
VIITWEGEENFSIKTKNQTIKLGKNLSLGDLVITEPGEYESGGIQIEVIDGIVEVFAEQISIGHIKKTKSLSDHDLEKLNNIEILLIGVGGGQFCETKSAIEIISQIEPNLVIPMHDNNLEEFAKEEGVSTQGVDNFKINKSELPQEERQIIILKLLTKLDLHIGY